MGREGGPGIVLASQRLRNQLTQQADAYIGVKVENCKGVEYCYSGNLEVENCKGVGYCHSGNLEFGIHSAGYGATSVYATGHFVGIIGADFSYGSHCVRPPESLRATPAARAPASIGLQASTGQCGPVRGSTGQ